TGYLLMYPILKIYEMDNNKQLIITKSRIIVFYINKKANFQKYISFSEVGAYFSEILISI
ncbi:hypothetical protein, partial [Enterococcus mundtii]